MTPTDERNPYSDKSPQQVVIISYTYENLGYEDDIQDLFIMPENVVDSAGIMGETYPVSTTGAKPTPVGATMSGAQAAYGVQNPGGNIKILFKNMIQIVLVKLLHLKYLYNKRNSLRAFLFKNKEHTFERSFKIVD